MEHSTAKKNKLLPIILVGLLVIALGLGLWFFLLRDTGYERYEFDVDAIAGRIQTLSEEEVQAELDRVVEEGMFNISIASSILFDPETGEGEARIENVEANRYHMQVDIFLDATGEKVYSSKLIKPGFSIEKIKLTKQLEPGKHEATAMFSAITQNEMQLFGQAGAQINLYVPDKDGNIPLEEPATEAKP